MKPDLKVMNEIEAGVASAESMSVSGKTDPVVVDSKSPVLAEQVEIVTPNEQDKRHGQAVAAASLSMFGKYDAVAPEQFATD